MSLARPISNRSLRSLRSVEMTLLYGSGRLEVEPCVGTQGLCGDGEMMVLSGDQGDRGHYFVVALEARRGTFFICNSVGCTLCLLCMSV